MASSDTTNKKYLYIIIALLLLVAFLTWKVFQETGVSQELTEINTELEADKDDMADVLQEMLAQYDTITVENEELNAEIIQQKTEIAELLGKVEKLSKSDKNYRYEVGKLKKETETLRTIMKGYLVKIDSLNQANAMLTEENLTLNTELTSVTSQKNELQNKVLNQQEIIKTGSVLRALDFASNAIRLRATGKQTETSRASRAEKIKAFCVLDENAIAPRGDKNIYIRIISPDGIVLEDPNNPNATFKFGGVSGKYSAKRVINYTGEAQNIEVYYDVVSTLSTGEYIVELYDEDSIIGRASFDLR